MTEYLVLLKLNPQKIANVINTLRDFPEKPSPGVDLHYLMNVFGTWDVAVWFDADSSDKAVDFIQKKIGQIPGVVDAFPVAAFPHTGQRQEREETSKGEKSESK